MHAVSTSGKYVAICIGVNAIGEPNIAVRKHLPVVQPLPIIRNIETVYRCGVGEIVLVWVRVRASVGNVSILEVWRELESVGSIEPVGYGLHNARVWLKSVDLVADDGRGAKVSKKGIFSLLDGTLRFRRSLTASIRRVRL